MEHSQYLRTYSTNDLAVLFADDNPLSVLLLRSNSMLIHQTNSSLIALRLRAQVRHETTPDASYSQTVRGPVYAYRLERRQTGFSLLAGVGACSVVDGTLPTLEHFSVQTRRR